MYMNGEISKVLLDDILKPTPDKLELVLKLVLEENRYHTSGHMDTGKARGGTAFP